MMDWDGQARMRPLPTFMTMPATTLRNRDELCGTSIRIASLKANTFTQISLNMSSCTGKLTSHSDGYTL